MGARKAPTPPPVNGVKPPPPPAPPEKRGRLDDLPRYLAAGGNRVLGEIVAEELARHKRAVSMLSAIVFQMEQGEASDALDIGVFGDGTQDDLRWCRDQLKEVLKTLS